MNEAVAGSAEHFREHAPASRICDGA